MDYYCYYCNRQKPDDGFCPYCGKKNPEITIDATAQETAQQPYQQPYSAPQQAQYPPVNGGDGQPPKKNNKTLIIVLVAIIAALLIAAGVTLGILLPKLGENKQDQSSTEPAEAAEQLKPVDEPNTDPEPATQATTEAPFFEDENFVSPSAFGDENNITLTVWMPDQAVNLTQQQVQDFVSHYTGLNMNISVVPMYEGDASTRAMNDPGTAADLFGFPSDQIDKLAAARVLAEVNKNYKGNLALNNVAGSIDGALNDQNGTDQMYAFPETADNGYYLVYDTSVVKNPGTLEGVLADCKAAGRKFVIDGGNGFYSCVYAFTGGVKVDGFEADGFTQRFFPYDETEAVDTLMAFAKLMKQYKGTYVHDTVSKIATGFSGKTVGAGVDGSWDSAANKKALGANFGAAKLPTINVNGIDKQLSGFSGYKYIGVNSLSAYPNAAQALAYYLTGEKCQSERMLNLGWGPSNINAQNNASSDPAISALLEQEKFNVPQVSIASTFWTAMGTLGSEMYKDTWKSDDRTATLNLLNKVIASIRDE